MKNLAQHWSSIQATLFPPWILGKTSNELIDNDIAFGQPIIATKTGRNTIKPCLEVKNVLYCLPLMKEPLSSETRDRILQSSPELILLRCLSRLQTQLALYDALKEKAYTKENRER